MAMVRLEAVIADGRFEGPPKTFIVTGQIRVYLMESGGRYDSFRFWGFRWDWILEPAGP